MRLLNFSFVIVVAATSAFAAERNVLVYVVDDLGMNDAGCYGNPVIRTPGLDALAASGVKLTHAYATTPSCSASRSVILSGRHNHATGQFGHAHSYNHFRSFEDMVTLPAILGEGGYRTWAVGKFHVAPDAVYPFDKKFGGPSPVEMAEKCRPLLEAESDDPFFLYFCTTEPHRPFKREGSTPVAPEDVIVPPYLPDTPECREELAQYYMSAERADSGLVALLAMLEETGHADDTLVIFLSDNGVAMPGAKTNLFEPGVNLPFVVRNPFSERAGATSDVIVNYADLAPTVLDFAGLAPAKGMQGRSFLSAIDEDSPEGWDETYLSHTFHEITMYYPVRVLRERRYKLMWNIAHPLPFPFASDLQASATWQGVLERGDSHYGKRPVAEYIQRPEFALYDLENDPMELNNLANDPAFSDRLAAMQGKLRAFQEATGDPWVLKWEYE